MKLCLVSMLVKLVEYNTKNQKVDFLDLVGLFLIVLSNALKCAFMI